MYPVLQNWYITEPYNKVLDAYTPPELRDKAISGEVYNHPNFEDGTRVLTSTVIRIKGMMAETLNSKYVLGVPEKEYLEWCRENDYDVGAWIPKAIPDECEKQG